MDRSQFTTMLQANTSGDEHALGEFIPLVYDEKHKIVYDRLMGEQTAHPSSAITLVHEACLKRGDFILDKIISVDHTLKNMQRSMTLRPKWLSAGFLAGLPNYETAICVEYTNPLSSLFRDR